MSDPAKQPSTSLPLTLDNAPYTHTDNDTLSHTHLHRTRSSYASCERCQKILESSTLPSNDANSTPSQNGTININDNTISVPYIVPEAPAWVHELKNTGQYIDRTSLYDMTGHILFDSLLGINGIKYFYYFMEDADHANRTIEAFSRRKRDESYQYEVKQIDGGKGPEARVAFCLGSNVCGHRGIVHGGLTATLIDEVSGASAFSAIGPCFTANLNVDYKLPLHADCWILVRSYVTKIEGRKAYIETTVEDGEGTAVYAKGRALFIRPRTSIEQHMEQSKTKTQAQQQ